MGQPIQGLLAGVAGQMQELAEAVRSLAADAPRTVAPQGEPPELVDLAARILTQRKARTRFLPPSLFHEPAWEVLLSLYVAQCRGETINIKHLTQAVDAPVTTAQRWVDALAHMRLVHRVVDESDRRRVELSLTQTAIQAIEGYLSWLADPDEERTKISLRP